MSPAPQGDLARRLSAIGVVDRLFSSTANRLKPSDLPLKGAQYRRDGRSVSQA